MTVKERENYESEMRTELDIIAERQFAVEKGREEGREEGMRHLLQTAKNLLEMGLSIADIAKATGLSEDQIQTMTI